MIKLLILADDLTGALDTGVQFAKRGMTTEVIMFREHAPIALGDWDVLVYDLESRHVTPEEAYSRTCAVVRAAMESGVRYIYNKVDSTQRGNVGSEMDAVLDASGKRQLFYAPSYPAQNRIVAGGILYVNGRSLMESEYLHDKFSSIHSERIPEIIAAQSRRESCVLTQDELMRGQGADADEIVVVDARTDEDLRAIARYLLNQYGEDVIYSGSAGFANAIAEILGDGRQPPPVQFKRGKTMVVCGSLNNISRRQIEELEREGVPSVDLDEVSLISESDVGCYEADQLFLEVYNLLREKDAVVLKHNFEQASSLPKSDGAGLEAGVMPKHIKVAIGTGKLACRVLRKLNLTQMVVIGGDTMFGVLQSLNCYEIMPRCEVLPGVIFSELRLENNSVVHIFSKAGGFGDDDTLSYVVRRITGDVEMKETI